MINMSGVINSPAFMRQFKVERTTGGQRIQGEYKPGNTTAITMQGILTNPKGTQITLTPEGMRSVSCLNIRVSADTPIYTTHDRADGNDISDIILIPNGLTNPDGTPQCDKYQIINVADYSQFGFYKAEAMREGAI
jgi:hypothetical protein